MADWSGAFAGQLEMGDHPGLLLVDPVNAYVEPTSPLFLDTGSAAVAKIASLVEQFRALNLPIAWTGVRYLPDGSDGGHFFKKVPALEVFVGETTLGSFPSPLSPGNGERLFIKQYPSAFFRTKLDKWLLQRNVDTLFLCGFSTSGCVRASALDALQNGFIPFVISDASADRNHALHTQNLRDIGAKYAEIVDTNKVMQLIGRSP